MTDETAVAFVTKKVLVTFSQEICLQLDSGGLCVFTRAAICEYVDKPDHHYSGIPEQFTVVALPNTQKMTKSLNLFVGRHGMTVLAMVELE